MAAPGIEISNNTSTLGENTQPTVIYGDLTNAVVQGNIDVSGILTTGSLVVTNTTTTTGNVSASGSVTAVEYLMTGKVIAANGATTSYTVPDNTGYVYLTTTAASLAVTLPAGSASIDGLEITIVPSATVATVTWVSTGASFVGAPAAFAANTRVSMIYNHATTAWYPI
jgi:hypothetical protein